MVLGRGERHFGPVDGRGKHLLEDPRVVIPGAGPCAWSAASAADRLTGHRSAARRKMG
ncbi:hypothetical protein [Streptomyces sp. NPDC096105]|uniref:hypothetical protein n=1 Tax=Streptomyces sp. NPDC096105 TaxID=3366074 RepID=UPI0037FFFEFF